MAAASAIIVSRSRFACTAGTRIRSKVLQSELARWCDSGRLDPTGAILWQVKSNYAYVGSVALNAGIAYATLDSTVQALDERSGSILWSYPAKAMFYASPVVVPSGIYAVDRGGNVYAFNE
jgi:outer membrane protein assembly factor BamB